MLRIDIRDKVIEIKNIVTAHDNHISLSRTELEATIRREVRKAVAGYQVQQEEQEEMERCVMDYISGLGPLGELLRDPDITEIMCNSYDRIFVERSVIMEETDVCFDSVEEMERIMKRIAEANDKEINTASPLLDAMLMDGSRVNMTLPPISMSGPTITIRKFPQDPMTMERLIENGSLTTDVANWLDAYVRARYNILISGGTGTGKTSFLNALSGLIPENERVITIEDSQELRLKNKNQVNMVARSANSAGEGEIPIRSLIRNALRMNPTRLIVGEVRGAEAIDMLQAMNTGHDGSFSTAHANSTEDMLSRLVGMVSEGANQFSDEAILRQIGSSLDMIIHLSKDMYGHRHVEEITEIVGYDSEKKQILTNRLYVRTPDGQLVWSGNTFRKTRKLESIGVRVA